MTPAKPKTKPTGRPSLLTPDRQQRIVTAIQNGAYAETAALTAGVSKRTYYRWMERGQAEEQRCIDQGHDPDQDPDLLDPAEATYWHFRQAVEKGQAAAELAAVSRIIEAGDGYEIRKERRIERANGDVEIVIETQQRRDWQAHAWWLERTRAARYSRRTQHEVMGVDGGPLAVSLTETRAKAREQILAFLDQAKEIQELPEATGG